MMYLAVGLVGVLVGDVRGGMLEYRLFSFGSLLLLLSYSVVVPVF